MIILSIIGVIMLNICSYTKINRPDLVFLIYVIIVMPLICSLHYYNYGKTKLKKFSMFGIVQIIMLPPSTVLLSFIISVLLSVSMGIKIDSTATVLLMGLYIAISFVIGLLFYAVAQVSLSLKLKEKDM